MGDLVLQPTCVVPEVCHLTQFVDIVLDDSKPSALLGVQFAAWRAIDDQGGLVRAESGLYGGLMEGATQIELFSEAEDDESRVTVWIRIPETHVLIEVPDVLLENVTSHDLDEMSLVLVAKSKQSQALQHVTAFRAAREFFDSVKFEHWIDGVMDHLLGGLLDEVEERLGG